MKHLKLYEEIYSDLPGDNEVFKIRYRSNTDLSNKRTPDTIDKPENDLLDNFQPGDIVTGKGVSDEKSHEGRILRIDKDSKGENLSVFIEEDGEEVELMPSTVEMVEEVGNQELDAAAKNVAAGVNVDQINPTNGDVFGPTTYESNGAFRLKTFKDFI